MTATLKTGPVLAGLDKPASALALGTAFYGADEQERWFELIDAFAAAGGTLIDSARLYAGGDSETIIGAWLERRAARDKMIVITKCGHGKDHLLPVERLAETVQAELAASLERLRTDAIDLYMLHRDNPVVSVAEIMDCLNATIAQGRVRALGASNWQYDRVDAANEYADKHGLTGFCTVSNHLSLAAPTAPFYEGLVSVDRAGERWHAATGIPLIAWSAQARGFFAGPYTAQMRDGIDAIQDDFTRRMIEVYCTDDNLERLDRARSLAAKKDGAFAVQIALAWVLHRPYPVIPIVGPHTPEELASCIAAAGLTLSDSEAAWLRLER